MMQGPCPAICLPVKIFKLQKSPFAAVAIGPRRQIEACTSPYRHSGKDDCQGFEIDSTPGYSEALGSRWSNGSLRFPMLARSETAGADVRSIWWGMRMRMRMRRGTKVLEVRTMRRLSVLC